MDKYTTILDAMQSLIIDNKGAACSVSDIARQAGIGKGSIYYYFKSKEEILDALVERNYGEVINKCKLIVEESNLPAIEKLALLFYSYYSSSVENAVDKYLHETQNACIHQKSLALILTSLAPIVASIIRQGIEENVFQCTYPLEFSEIILAELGFVFDPGIFSWTPAQIQLKLQALAIFSEKSLSAPENSLAFLTTFSAICFTS